MRMFLGLKLPVGKTTVMHLVSRETVPEPQSAGKSGFFLILMNQHAQLYRVATSWKSP